MSKLRDLLGAEAYDRIREQAQEIQSTPPTREELVTFVRAVAEFDHYTLINDQLSDAEAYAQVLRSIETDAQLLYRRLLLACEL